MACKKDHSTLEEKLLELPEDQGGLGRHKCAACAYDAGYSAGYNLDFSLQVDKVLKNLEESQAGAQRHKSAHVAFALGYYEGVRKRVIEDN